MTKGGPPSARALAVLSLFVVVMWQIRPAHASPARARAHFERGQAAMSQGDPALAATEFEAAWQAERAPRALLAIALAYEKAGDRQAAMAYYWWYLNSGAASASEESWLFAKIVELSAEAPARPKAVATSPAPSEPRRKTEAAPAPAPREPAPPAPHASREVHFPPPDDAPEAPGPTRPRWYGAPMLVTEGIGLGILVGGVAGDAQQAIVLGTIVVVVTSPVVHTYYGHGGRGWGGLFLRLGAAGLGALAGGTTGATVGYLGALALDSLAMARDDVPEEKNQFAPLIEVGNGAASFGLAGTF